MLDLCSAGMHLPIIVANLAAVEAPEAGAAAGEGTQAAAARATDDTRGLSTAPDSAAVRAGGLSLLVGSAAARIASAPPLVFQDER